MTPRSTRRADGRYGITARLDNPDGTSRRVYFYGRTQPRPGPRPTPPASEPLQACQSVMRHER